MHKLQTTNYCLFELFIDILDRHGTLSLRVLNNHQFSIRNFQLLNYNQNKTDENFIIENYLSQRPPALFYVTGVLFI